MWTSPANKDLGEAVMRKLMDSPFGAEVQAEAEAARLRVDAEQQLAELEKQWSERRAQLQSKLNTARTARDTAKANYDNAQNEFQRIGDDLDARMHSVASRRVELRGRVSARRSALVR